jgi:ABC-type multidrug transport system ATPase subunit
MPIAMIGEAVSVLVCSNVSIRAGRRVVVDLFSWVHRPGGIAWLMGANGSGKSSLLRVFAGWQQPTTGDAQWFGLLAGHVRYYAPTMSAPPRLRVSEFLGFVSQRLQDDDPELTALRPVIETPIRFKNLSTGEAKRLLLWSLLRHEAGPLILDEPYEHLARDARTALTHVLQRIACQSVVVVATNQDVPVRPEDTVLTLERATVEVTRAFS